MIHNWFETKVRYSKMQENGVEKKSVESGLHPYVAKRVRGTHMELNTTKEVLQAQNLTMFTILYFYTSRKTTPILSSLKSI